MKLFTSNNKNNNLRSYHSFHTLRRRRTKIPKISQQGRNGVFNHRRVWGDIAQIRVRGEKKTERKSRVMAIRDVIYHISIDCLGFAYRFIVFLVGWLFLSILTPFFHSVFWLFSLSSQSKGKTMRWKNKPKRPVWDGYKEGIESRMFVFMRFFLVFFSLNQLFFFI